MLTKNKTVSKSERLIFLIIVCALSIFAGCNNGKAIDDPSLLEPLSNNLGMTFQFIPAGTFTMGSPPDEPGRDDDETQHQVTITEPFYMQTTEVTQGQWEEVMGNNPVESEEELRNFEILQDLGIFDSSLSAYDFIGENYPAIMVSWEDVQVFIAMLNNQEEGTYRLPTDAEWEYACRAGSNSSLSNGTLSDPEGNDLNLNKIGWYLENSGGHPHPVGQKSPNDWGLYDMHGNVSEWCSDWYTEDLGTSEVTNPTGPTSGWALVLRSGNWDLDAKVCRSASRDLNHPELSHTRRTGFRLVWEP